MIKTIKLVGSLARFVDREPFLLPDSLALHFEHKGYDLSQAFITLKNGEQIKKLKFQNPFEVPKEFLYAGDLFCKIEMYLGEAKAKEWTSLPIRIVETESGIQVSDLIYELEKKIASAVPQKDFNPLINKVNELIEKQNRLADTVKEIKENY